MKLVDGKNVYIQDFQGNVVKVTTNASTDVNVTSKGTVSDLRPGTSVIVEGTAEQGRHVDRGNEHLAEQWTRKQLAVRWCGLAHRAGFRLGERRVARRGGELSVRARLVLSTLCVFNAGILLVLGGGSVAFVDGRTRYALAAVLWVSAVALFMVSRRLRRGTDWP